MEDRTEAVEYLRSHGLHAWPRDNFSNLGDCIMVGIEPSAKPPGIMGYRGMICIFPRNGLWDVIDFIWQQGQPVSLQTSLSDACEATILKVKS